MLKISNTIAAIALGGFLATTLAACGTADQYHGNSDASSSSTAQSSSDILIGGWVIASDALASKTPGGYSVASWDDKHYVTVFDAGERSVVRLVVDISPKVSEQLSDLDASKADYEEKFEEVIGKCQIARVEDLTVQKLTEEQLGELAGKTSEDLLADGMEFQDYAMYGGEQTVAVMAKGYLAYNVTFDASVPDDIGNAGDDGGAALADAKISMVEYAGGSEAAIDLERL